MTDLPPEFAARSSSSSPSGQSYIIHAYEHRAYPLSEDESFWIGRGSQCDIMVSEVFVSRQHAEIRSEGSEYVIHPVGATPTLVNDSAIHNPKVLRDGDVINIGTMRFVFSRGRLPVAIQIADPWLRESRLYDEVSDRRPTLTFPVQTAADVRVQKEPTVPWVWIVIVFGVLAIGYGIWWLATTQ